MVQGSGIDASLNKKGQKQADAFFNAYKEVPFDKIYITPLRRTKETVARFIDLGIPFDVLDGLREISWGNQEGVPFTKETGTAYRRIVQMWTEGDLDLRIEGGESPIEVMERQVPAMNHILAMKDENPVLICTHGRAMRILLCWLLNKSLTEMDHFGHSNCGLYVLDFDGEHFDLKTFNETAHLSDINTIE